MFTSVLETVAAMKVVFLGLFIQIRLNCSIQGNPPSGGLPLLLRPSVWAQHCRKTITSAAATAWPAPALPFSPSLKCTLGDTRVSDCSICHPTDLPGLIWLIWLPKQMSLSSLMASCAPAHAAAQLMRMTFPTGKEDKSLHQLLCSPVRASKQVLKCALVSTAV